MAVKYSLDPNGMVRQYYQKEEDNTITATSDENWKLGGLKVIPHKRHHKKNSNRQNKINEGTSNPWDSSIKVNHNKRAGSSRSFYENTYCGMTASEQLRMMRKAYNAGHSDACHHRYSPPGGLTEGQMVLSIIKGAFITIGMIIIASVVLTNIF